MVTMRPVTALESGCPGISFEIEIASYLEKMVVPAIMSGAYHWKFYKRLEVLHTIPFLRRNRPITIRIAIIEFTDLLFFVQLLLYY